VCPGAALALDGDQSAQSALDGRLAAEPGLQAAGGLGPAQSGLPGAFVQATILDPATGAPSVYDPLVITQGTTPADAPTVPALPANAVMTIEFGFNGTDPSQMQPLSYLLGVRRIGRRRRPRRPGPGVPEKATGHQGGTFDERQPGGPPVGDTGIEPVTSSV
jgi:hypothetical protein